MEARDLTESSPEPFQISLRVRHPTIDPALISRELKVEPEHCFKAGDPRESSSGIAAAAVHGESYWLGSLQTHASVAPMAGFTNPRARSARGIQTSTLPSLTVTLDAVVVAFMRQHGEFIRRLQNERAQVTLLVEISRESLTGFTISPQFARVLSDLGIGMELDFVTD
jgi:hypothetical protein